MDSRNRSTVIEFILLGLSSDPSIQIILFIIFLAAYLASLAANCLLILAVSVDRHLHNPMYFFLINLSLVNLGGPSVSIPKMLLNFLYGDESILFAGCAAQVFFSILLGSIEGILLVFMSYDRFIAICKPLRYHMVMTRSACTWMIAVTWTVSCVMSSVNTFLLCSLTYCGPNIINHFFCVIPSLMLLSCNDNSLFDVLIVCGSTALLLIPLILIIFSYYKIMASILGIQSGRHKAFSTCLSHLIVVAMFYGIAVVMFMQPTSSVDDNRDKIVSVFYVVVTPLLNPLIYSLKNKDVHRAIRRLAILQ
ncbi:olfactory receptor 1361-like [Pelobates fuscus]|uniref:olfactory receptor 1361-like n=1 Tax=Pelobates fuscus TaxID=191477 RepID=UPI002FE48604